MVGVGFELVNSGCSVQKVTARRCPLPRVVLALTCIHQKHRKKHRALLPQKTSLVSENAKRIYYVYLCVLTYPSTHFTFTLTP